MKWNNRKGNFSQKPQREFHAKTAKEISRKDRKGTITQRNAKKGWTMLREMKVLSAGNSSVGSARDKPLHR